MSISRLARSRYTLQRTSPYLLDPVTASGSGHTPTRQPPAPSSIQIRAEAAGSVAILGTVDGATVTETLTFTGAGYRATARRFSAVTSITPSGAIIATTFHAKSLGADGSPHPKMKANVATGLLGAFSPGAPRWAARKEVQVEKRQAMIAFDYTGPDPEFRRGDHLLDEDTAERWKIEGTNLLGGMMPHHWECHASLWDGDAPE